MEGLQAQIIDHGIDNQYYNGLLPHTYGTTLNYSITTPH
jgi:hypothetical protein